MKPPRYVVYACFEDERFPPPPECQTVIEHDGEVIEVWEAQVGWDIPTLIGPFDTRDEADAAKEHYLMRSMVADEENVGPDGDRLPPQVAWVLEMHSSVDELFERPDKETP